MLDSRQTTGHVVAPRNPWQNCLSSASARQTYMSSIRTWTLEKARCHMATCGALFSSSIPDRHSTKAGATWHHHFRRPVVSNLYIPEHSHAALGKAFCEYLQTTLGIPCFASQGYAERSLPSSFRVQRVFLVLGIVCFSLVPIHICSTCIYTHIHHIN